MSAAEFFDKLRHRLRAFPSRGIEAPGLSLREAAVLAPVFWRGSEPWVYLTKRPRTLRTHPGQISFPGGGRDSEDLTPLHAALRETHEELGIDPLAVDVLGMLGALPTISSYFVIPFVGAIPETLTLAPNPAEIEEVIAAPLWRLRHEHRNIWGADRDVYVWDDGRHVVWGVTWRLMKQLLEQVAAVGR